jgi:hypothetical protein
MDTSSEIDAETASEPPRLRDRWPHFTPVVVGLIIVLLTFANLLIIPPLNRLLESNMCRQFYEDLDPSLIPPDMNVPEHECKIEAVQERLAKLIGLITTLGIVCGELDRSSLRASLRSESHRIGGYNPSGHSLRPV